MLLLSKTIFFFFKYLGLIPDILFKFLSRLGTTLILVNALVGIVLA